MISTAGTLRRAFILASVAWAVLLPVTPLLTGGALGGLPVYGAALVYAFGSLICHQIPARSFHLGAEQMPVCARCAGIYVGAASAALWAAAVRPLRWDFGSARTMLLIAALPTLVTLAYEWGLGQMPSNAIRAMAALPLGAAASAIVLASASDRVN